MKMPLHYYIPCWTFWLETGEETKDLLDIKYTPFWLKARIKAKKIANETGKIVYIRRYKMGKYKGLLQDTIYPKGYKKKGK